MAISQVLICCIFLMGIVVFGDPGHGKPHSYHHQSGPVIGHHQKVEWKDKHGHHYHDYKAHPHYKFSYGVSDPHHKDYHGQKEQRDVDTTPNPNPGPPLLIYSFRVISLDQHQEKSNEEILYEEKFNEEEFYEDELNDYNKNIDY